jgi:hypothetical protein
MAPVRSVRSGSGCGPCGRRWDEVAQGSTYPGSTCARAWDGTADERLAAAPPAFWRALWHALRVPPFDAASSIDTCTRGPSPLTLPSEARRTPLHLTRSAGLRLGAAAAARCGRWHAQQAAPRGRLALLPLLWLHQPPLRRCCPQRCLLTGMPAAAARRCGGPPAIGQRQHCCCCCCCCWVTQLRQLGRSHRLTLLPAGQLPQARPPPVMHQRTQPQPGLGTAGVLELTQPLHRPLPTCSPATYNPPHPPPDAAAGLGAPSLAQLGQRAKQPLHWHEAIGWGEVGWG